MTIMNMVGGGGDTATRVNIDQYLYNTYEGNGESSTSSRVWKGSAIPTGSSYYAYNMGTYKTITATSMTDSPTASNKYICSFSQTSQPTFSTDRLGTYLKSICPSDKTFNGRAQGIIVINKVGCGYANYDISGSNTSISYSGKTYGTGFVSSSSGDRPTVYFYPTSIDISYS